MSRSSISRADREQAKRALVHSYGLSHGTSGEVKVTSLGFSDNPRNWRLKTHSRHGAGYPGNHWRRNDIHITAVISPHWAVTPAPLDVTLYDAERHHHHLIAGKIELPPPEGVERLELLCISPFHKLHLTSEYLFRFTAGGFIGIPEERFATYPPKQAVRLMHGKFNAMIAAAMVQRLKPASLQPGVRPWRGSLILARNAGKTAAALKQLTSHARLTAGAFEQLAAVLSHQPSPVHP